ncbi:hypothetical protein [Actinomadura sp. HBU206391]|uniref:hypothetical protein n=1 Tax=Actinomadura sp. HBU206391 TaxID=2731692 RepID=UPI00164EE8C3|nr:hypothetical protein [Actinomadura sp. HBU206391]MBC6460037.1 hypothetical protein [Actinomadura sp. HBU206391]
MALEEKRAWIMAAVTVGTYAVYVAVVLGRLLHTPVGEVHYVATLLWTLGIAITATIVLHIAVAMAAPQEAGRRDERDREIGLFSEHVGHSFVVIGGVAAFCMALAELDHFWIANVMYLAFALSAIFESVSKIFAYRRGFQPW